MTAKALKEFLLFVREFVPESMRGFLNLVANAIGALDLPPGDPKLGKLIDVTVALVRDLRRIGEARDTAIADRLRLVAENRFVRAWSKLGLPELRPE